MHHDRYLIDPQHSLPVGTRFAWVVLMNILWKIVNIQVRIRVSLIAYFWNLHWWTLSSKLIMRCCGELNQWKDAECRYWLLGAMGVLFGNSMFKYHKQLNLSDWFAIASINPKSNGGCCIICYMPLLKQNLRKWWSVSSKTKLTFHSMGGKCEIKTLRKKKMMSWSIYK